MHLKSINLKPVALADDPKYPANMDFVRKLFELVALLCCAITLAAPSSARSLHLAEHVSAPVAAGEFHSHDEPNGHEDAVPVDHDAPVPADSNGQDKSGHSHMPGSVSDLSHLREARLPLRHLVEDQSHAAAQLPALTTRGWSPPVRPPRSA